MNQDIIVIFILVFTLSAVVYKMVKPMRKNMAKHKCEGCSGCELSQLKNMKKCEDDLNQ